MKKITFLISFIFLLAFFCVPAEALDVSPDNFCLMDGTSGEILLESNGNEKLGMASTTKIMTCLIAIEKGNLDKLVDVADEAIGVEGSSVYLQKGECLTLEQLLYCVMLQSANDAATAVAVEVGGNYDNFVNMMNEKACELELHSTKFTNPHGLYDENHYTTPNDLATLAKVALQNPEFMKIVSTKEYIIPKTETTQKRVLSNHNKLLRQYDGCIGVKTGYTVKCGRCLVSAAEKKGVRLICVTLRDGNDWKDHTSLLNYGFSLYKNECIVAENAVDLQIPVIGGDNATVDIVNKTSFDYPIKASDKIETKIYLDSFLFAPVEQNGTVGYISILKNGVELSKIDLIATKKINKQYTNQTLTDKLRSILWKK